MRSLLILALAAYILYSYAKTPQPARGSARGWFVSALGNEFFPEQGQKLIDAQAAIPAMKSRAFLRSSNSDVCQYASGFAFGGCHGDSPLGDVIGSAFSPNSPYDGSIGNGINFAGSW